jgi:hypothetical protein
MTSGYLVDTDGQFTISTVILKSSKSFSSSRKTDCDCPSYLWRNFMKESTTRGIRRERGKLNNFLSGIVVMGIDEEICKMFGKERGRLRKTKKVVGSAEEPQYPKRFSTQRCQRSRDFPEYALYYGARSTTNSIKVVEGF